MPELPEVETVVRGLTPLLVGRRLVRVEVRRGDLRQPVPKDFAARLTGGRVIAVGRRAKYLLIHLDDGDVAIGHLGMSGRITASPGRPNALDRHDHILFETDAGDVLRFNDPRRFGLFDLARSASLDAHPLLAGLGPEPLDDAFDGPALATAIASRSSPIKTVLLDQSVVAGVGNIYACEALFQAGLSPRRLAAQVQGARADRLARAIKDVLARAIAVGGSSLRDHVRPSGELGYFQHAWAVYGREGEGCPGCDCRGGVKRIQQANRSTFYCGKRQR
jgi:formamidopyrimidine-DNA glycosylase